MSLPHDEANILMLIRNLLLEERERSQRDAAGAVNSVTADLLGHHQPTASTADNGTSSSSIGSGSGIRHHAISSVSSSSSSSSSGHHHNVIGSTASDQLRNNHVPASFASLLLGDLTAAAAASSGSNSSAGANHELLMAGVGSSTTSAGLHQQQQSTLDSLSSLGFFNDSLIHHHPDHQHPVHAASNQHQSPASMLTTPTVGLSGLDLHDMLSFANVANLNGDVLWPAGFDHFDPLSSSHLPTSGLSSSSASLLTSTSTPGQQQPSSSSSLSSLLLPQLMTTGGQSSGQQQQHHHHQQQHQISLDHDNHSASTLMSSSTTSNSLPNPLTSSSALLFPRTSPTVLRDHLQSKHLSNTHLVRFESQIRSIANEIQATIQLHLNGLQMRKEQLLKQLEHIKQIYLTVILHNHGHGQSSSSGGQHSPTSVPLPQISFTRPDSALYKAVTSLGFLTTPAFAANCLPTGEGLEVATEGQPACFSIATRNCFNEDLLLGGEKIDIEIVGTSSASSPSSSAGINGPVSSADRLLDNEVGQHFGNQQQQPVTIPHSLVDHNNGKYTCTYTVPRSAQLSHVMIRVAVNSLPVTGSPFLVKVETQRQRHSWRRVATYGCEGNAPGQFCRPWGVACVPLAKTLSVGSEGGGHSSSPGPEGPGLSKDYLIAVADRSNNRIQLLKLALNNNNASNSSNNNNNDNNNATSPPPAISVIHIFGSGPGTRPGQFDRPAGIAINTTLGHIIVADKDNHRVQVFDMTGNYQFKFGEKGSRAGQFCYPWDLDSSPYTQQILVSDTRNRRVQMFTPYGQYLWHVGQPLDSPRGVAFLSQDKFVVSDFNKHRLIVMDKNTAKSPTPQDDPATTKYVGFGEGSAWGEFLRPQGVATGQSGATVLCSDSRNNRISVWCSATQNFEYLADDVLSLDRPAGLAVADNVLIVVDFGNNRLQICQR